MESMVLIYSLFSVLLLVGLTPSTGAERLFINISPSIPMGLYRSVEGGGLEIGDTVVLRVNKRVREIAEEANLIEHTKLLFKRVAGVNGDRYCGENGVLEVSGRRFPQMKKTKDGKKLSLVTGCRILEVGELLMVGDTANSFDSRYFGAVSEEDIVSKVVPVILF